MSGVTSIVCATDLSEGGDEAMAQAAALAAAHRARLTIVHAIEFAYAPAGDSPVPPFGPVVDEAAMKERVTAEIRSHLARAANAAEAAIDIRVDPAPPSVSIIGCADANGADLVVVGSRGLTGLRRMALGSVAEGVVRHASCPVLVARSSPATGQVLAATDLSDLSFPALTAADAEAKRREAKLTVVHCMDFPPTMMALGFAPLVPLPPEHPDSRVAQTQRAESNVREILARLGVSAETVVTPGRAAHDICTIAENLPAELVVVGTRGRTGLKRLVLGSVAESVVRYAPCSVLAVRLDPT